MKAEWTKTKAKLCCLVALAGGSALQQPPQSAAPLPFVSPIFGDNMVLQREKPNAIWGCSQPGDSVRVEIGESTATATAGADGEWQTRINLPRQAARTRSGSPPGSRL
jgi:hypothetical protein